MRFTTNYRSINKKLDRKPYPSPRIGKTIQQLEILQYATALDINMVYYNTRLLPKSQDMMTIVTEFDRFIYNCIPMGMCALGDIFQSKVDKLLSDIKLVKTYIDDLLVFINVYQYA